MDAPYFVDMVNDTLQSKFQDADFQSNAFRVYTTLDMRLQRAAAEAVRQGMIGVTNRSRSSAVSRDRRLPTPQVALVAIDPHTGEIKALVGGRNYGLSQLNHVAGQAAARVHLQAIRVRRRAEYRGRQAVRRFSPPPPVVDEPTTFCYDGQSYTPSNFEQKFYGTVTLRNALAHSLNVATVKVGEMVGFDAVVDMANRAGMNYKIQPTPAVALGAYEITPVEAAGAYTIFANSGEYVKPSFVSMVRAQDGKVVYKNKVEEKQVLDPRVAYLMTNLMEEVMRTGTAAGVRARYNLTVPAAGKTGTSHDGWFAGYTSELLCMVWVGFDDNRELDLEGAHSAAPIWAEFMKRALEYREYRDVQPFDAPDGIVSISIDPDSGMPATPNCPKTRTEVYIAGTEPVGVCPLHGGRGGATTVSGWDTSPQPAATTPAAHSAPTITGSQGDGQVPADPAARRAARQAAGQAAGSPVPPASPKEEPKKEKEKKGIFQRLLHVFK